MVAYTGYYPGPSYIFWLISGKSLQEIMTEHLTFSFLISGSLLPLGLLLWVAFVIPMLFVNITFIEQSLSDPFGWGWDFFGTANTPWHQFLPRYIPWFQAILVLAGFYFCLRNLKMTLINYQLKNKQILMLCLPFVTFITSATVFMLFFFTN